MYVLDRLSIPEADQGTNNKFEPDKLAKPPLNERELSVIDLLQIFWRRGWTILLVAATLTVSVVAFDLLLRTPTYEASAEMLLRYEQQSPASVQELERVMPTMLRATDSLPFAEDVVSRLDLDIPPEQVVENLSAVRSRQPAAANTPFFEIVYRDENPQRARLIVETAVEVFNERISEVNPSATPISARVWRETTLQDTPVAPKPWRDGIIALVCGMALGMTLAIILERPWFEQGLQQDS